LGRRIVALINTYFLQNEDSHSGAASFSSQSEKQQPGTKR
jgi:hypothetical protein